MKGLIIWAYSNCRSTMALYREIQRQATFPVRIVLSKPHKDCSISDERRKLGFRTDEFADVDKIALDGDYSRGIRILDECPGFAHVFCAYQRDPVCRKLLEEAHRRGEQVFAAGEAPCNSEHGLRRLFKAVYLRTILRFRVRNVVRFSQKFLCFSGNAHELAALIGWPKEKVVPFGYYSPSLEGSHCVKRASNRDFVILATGILTWRRGADVLVRALKLLKDWGVRYRAVITQDGELLSAVKSIALRYDLPIVFPGFLPMPELIRLYETCSVYVGAGRREPWGMRLNDALNCGAPLVVSRGMGGAKLVDDYGCGLACRANDPLDMARQLQKLAKDEELYARVVQRAFDAVARIDPKAMAGKFLGHLLGGSK